jgi:hypothetical protein
MVVEPSPKVAVMERMGGSRVTMDFLHLDDTRDENDYDLQVAYTIQEHINVKRSSSL